LDVVRKAAPRRQADGDGSKVDDRASPARAPSAEDLGPLTQAEYDSYVPRTQKRIRQLMSQNEGLKAQLGSASVKAQTTDQLQKFLKTADIAKEDFGLVLDLAAAMRRGDFRAFLEGVTPYVRLAQESLGVTLPQDLMQAVQQGHMTQDAARYVAQERGARQIAEARAQKLTSENTVQTTQREREAFQTSIAHAVSAWEGQVRKSDPDYARKEPLVRDLLHAVVQERGPPRSEEEAVNVARVAYDRANAIVSGFQPRLQPTRPVPSSIATRVNGSRPEPKSLKEAIHYALERGR
jgi:hypothetical protein